MNEEYEVDFHAGDTVPVIFDYTVDDIPLEDCEVEEIEFSFGLHKYYLSKGDIAIDAETGKYAMTIPQEATLDMAGTAEWKIRIKIDGQVLSDAIQELRVGRTLSMEVI